MFISLLKTNTLSISGEFYILPHTHSLFHNPILYTVENVCFCGFKNSKNPVAEYPQAYKSPHFKD